MANDIVMSLVNLFKAFNTTKSTSGDGEVLDADEVRAAQLAGFSIFNLRENMTENEFITEAIYADLDAETDEDRNNMENKIRETHIKFIQMKYKSEEPIRENETYEEYETRLRDASLLGDILSSDKLTDEDREIYNNALNNSDNFKIVYNAREHFCNRFSGEECNELGPIFRKLYDLEGEFTEEYINLDFPPNESETLSLFTGGGITDLRPEEQTAKIHEARELVKKYQNYKCMQWVESKIDEWVEYLEKQ